MIRLMDRNRWTTVYIAVMVTVIAVLEVVHMFGTP